MSGEKKAAALLAALGPELAASVLKELRSPYQIEKVAYELSNLGAVSGDVTKEVLAESFRHVTGEEKIAGGVDLTREILRRAMGDQRAAAVLSRAEAGMAKNPFDFMKSGDPALLQEFIRSEHPQTAALILAHLPPDQAGSILASLDQELQAEVAKRIALMEATPPEVLDTLTASIKDRIFLTPGEQYASPGGTGCLVRMLNTCGRQAEKNILSGLSKSDPELAEEIKNKLFVFEDVTLLDDRSMQRVLREVDYKELAVALRSASEAVKGHIFRNMSARAAEALKEEMELSPPVRLKTVEEVQHRIVNLVRKLEEAEEVVIMRGGEGDVLV